MHDALDSENTELLSELTEQFETQCENVFLSKLAEKAQGLQNTIENCNLRKIRKMLEELSHMCECMALSKPETVSMLVRINKKHKGAKVG